MSSHSAALREFRPILTELANQGWELDRTTRGHFAAKPPGGGDIIHFAPSTEPHSIKNALQHLRLGGFKWPPPQKTRQKPVMPALELVRDVIEATSGLVTTDNGASWSEPLPLDREADPADVEEPREVQEAPEDRAWRILRDAHAYAKLAGQCYHEAQEALARAQVELEESAAEYRSACEETRAAKTAFDALFTFELPGEPR